MKMNLILHPGHGKCGSTTIQQFLYDNRAALEGKGYAVPDRFLHFRFERNCDFSVAESPVHYFSEVTKQGNYFLLEKRIEKAIESARKSGIHTFIISAENLSDSSTGLLHEIFLRYFNIKKVLCYIRRQDDFLLSAWQQWGHKSGRIFVEYCTQQIRNGYPQFTHTIKMLESHYGKNTLEVAPFSTKVFHNGDLISDFLVRTGLDAFIYPKPTSNVENRSLNPLVCEYLAQFPEIYRSVHDNRPKADLERYESSEPWLFDPRKDYLTGSQRRSIMNHFEAENRKLHSTYFPYLSFDLLFGISTVIQENEQSQQPKIVEKQQLGFLEDWVEKWPRLKYTRLFLNANKKLIQAIRRPLSGLK